MDDTSRRSPSVSRVSSRPRLTSTRARVCPPTRSLCANATYRTTDPSAFLRLVTRRNMSTSQSVNHAPRGQDTTNSCVHTFRPPQARIRPR